MITKETVIDFFEDLRSKNVFDASNENVFYHKIRDYLEDVENKGLWEYEEACISESHQEET